LNKTIKKNSLRITRRSQNYFQIVALINVIKSKSTNYKIDASIELKAIDASIELKAIDVSIE